MKETRGLKGAFLKGDLIFIPASSTGLEGNVISLITASFKLNINPTASQTQLETGGLECDHGQSDPVDHCRSTLQHLYLPVQRGSEVQAAHRHHAARLRVLKAHRGLFTT